MRHTPFDIWAVVAFTVVGVCRLLVMPYVHIASRGYDYTSFLIIGFVSAVVLYD